MSHEHATSESPLRFPARRHEEILRRLERYGSIRVMELVREFGVTDETIRRDLDALAAEGRLVRTHGGATLAYESRLDLPLPEREALNRGEKLRIARLAATLVVNRSTVFLDASSTVLTMAGQLKDVEATIITNASHVVAALADTERLHVVCSGGDYERRSRAYVGPLAEEAARHYHIEWMFIGVNGLHHQWGGSEVNPGQARLKGRIVQMAEKVCVLADPSKLDLKSSFLITPIEEIDLLITNREADPMVLEQYRKAGLEIWLAE